MTSAGGSTMHLIKAITLGSCEMARVLLEAGCPLML